MSDDVCVWSNHSPLYGPNYAKVPTQRHPCRVREIGRVTNITVAQVQSDPVCIDIRVVEIIPAVKNRAKRALTA